MAASPESAGDAHCAHTGELESKSLRKQCIQSVIQLLQCLEPPLTPLGVLLEVIRSNDNGELKTNTLRPDDVTKLLEALASCEASRDAVQRFIEDRALGTALKRAETETENVVAQIGDQFRHPILLGHAVIRSEPTVAPFLKAILDQVNNVAMLGKQTNIGETQQDCGAEDMGDSDIAVEDAVEAMLFNYDEFGSVTSAVNAAAQGDSVQDASPTNAVPVESVGLSRYAAKLIGAPNLPDSLTHSVPTSTTPLHQDLGNDPFLQAESNLPDGVCLSSSEPNTVVARIVGGTDEQVATAILAGPSEAGPVQIPGHPNMSRLESASNHEPRTLPDMNASRRQKGTTEKALQESAKARTGRYGCHFCDKTFRQKQSLQDHLNTHTGQTPYVCAWTGCNQRFTHYTTFRRHYQTYHKSSKDKRPNNKPIASSSQDNSGLGQISAVELQMKDIPPKDPISAATTFANDSRSVTQGKVSIRLPALDGDTTESVPKLNSGAQSSPYTAVKIESSDSATPDVIGSVNLNRSLKRKQLVQAQGTSRSKKPSIFTCDVCPKVFRSSQNQRDHMNIHAGLKPYKCARQGCGKRFTYISNFYEHRKTAHGN